MKCLTCWKSLFKIASFFEKTIFFSDGTPARPSAVSTPTVSGPDRIEKIEHPGVSALKKPFVRQVTSPGLSETPLSTSRFNKHYKTVILKRSNSIEIGTSQVSKYLGTSTLLKIYITFSP